MSRAEKGNFSYPPISAGNDVETAAGVEFADPYRCLEADDEAVREWQAAQNRLTEQYIQAWPHFSALKEIVSHYFVDRIAALPRCAGGKWFRAEQSKHPAAPRIVVSDTPYGTGLEIELGPFSVASVFVSWVSPSPDGRMVAIGICTDGSENNRIQLIEVATGNALTTAPTQLVMDSWMGGAQWLPDSRGFYFLALQGEAHAFKQNVLFHDCASGEQEVVPIPLPDPKSSDYTLISISTDGRHVVANHGLFAPKPVAIRDLTRRDSKWRPFVTQGTETIAGFARGEHYVAMTNVGAPRGRIVAIPINGHDPNDTRQWIELVAETDFVMRSIRQVGNFLYCSGFVATYSEVRIFHLDGTPAGTVPTPPQIAITDPHFPLMALVPRGHRDEYHFVYSSFTQSWGAYRHIPGARAVECLRSPAVMLKNAVVEDHWATSSDGTRIPYHTIRLPKKEADLAPALVYAYGAFNFPLVPEYPGAMAAFIAAGGIYVHGHIRGGSELGLDWWRGGRMQNKQNCYRDLYAIAEDLVGRGLTKPSMLAMTGRSNGGLMAGVAATQRPELWKAIVSEVPVADLIGMLRESYGHYAVSREFADPDDPDEVVRLSTFSPYHLVRDNTAYPAIYINSGATDPRCPPWHARKFAARLQAASSSDSPVLLRIRANAGHGEANGRATQLDSYAEWLAFLMMQLQMRPSR